MHMRPMVEEMLRRETLRVHANGERPSSSAKPDWGKTELVMVKCE